MSSQFKITEGQIRARAGDKSFARGESYYRDEAVFDLVQRGDVIEGLCQGSMPSPYQVRARLGKQGITETFCTCEYDFGGDCKHIIALLLTYLHQPNKFEQRQSTDDVLTAWDKNELISLIREMVTRYPDLQILIDRPRPGKAAPGKPLDTAAFRKELRRAMKSYEGWGDKRAENAIASILRTAETFSGRDDWAGASAIYRAIIEEVLDNTDYFYYDESGDFFGAVDEVVNRLAECLDNLADNDQERRYLIDALLSVYLADIDVGDVGAGAPDFLIRFAKPADLPHIREQVEAAKARAERKPYGEWAVKGYLDFLSELDVLDNVDPEVTLMRLRDAEMYDLLFRKLLEMGRLDEAVEVVEKHLTSAHERQYVLPALVASKREVDAIRLAKATLSRVYDDVLMAWLLKQLEAQGNREEVFKWELKRMNAAPNDSHYASLKKASQALGNWATVRPDVIGGLEKKELFEVLTRIYLQDEEWDKAWETVVRQPTKKSGYTDFYYYSSQPIELEVADRTRKTHPQKAIAIYEKYARKAIDRRSRDSYHEAAALLVKVQELYDQIDEPEKWESLIEGVRTTYKRLPALQDELRQAGL